MVPSWLPLLSLLGLFGAVLMMTPEEGPRKFLPTPLSDPEVRAPLGVAVEQFNQEESDSPNYYKVLSLQKAKHEDPPYMTYFLEVEFVKTKCKKKPRRMKFKRIQKCKRLPGNHKVLICYFVGTTNHDEPHQMILDYIGCS